jgi:hypothetical protein
MSVIAHAYDGSFGGVGFMQLVPLSSAPIVESSTEYHIPTTNDNVEIQQGLTFRNFSIKVAMDTAELTSLEAIVGNRDTLIFHRGTWTNVRLKSIDAPIKSPGFATYEVTLNLRRGN